MVFQQYFSYITAVEQVNHVQMYKSLFCNNNWQLEWNLNLSSELNVLHSIFTL